MNLVTLAPAVPAAAIFSLGRFASEVPQQQSFPSAASRRKLLSSNLFPRPLRIGSSSAAIFFPGRYASEAPQQQSFSSAATYRKFLGSNLFPRPPRVQCC